MKIGYKSISLKSILTLILLLVCSNIIQADIIVYDPFENAVVGNGENDKLNGEYNAGSQFRDFTNGNNNTVAGGQIVGFSADNAWAGNSSSAGTNQLIGPTDPAGLSFSLNTVTNGNVQVRGLEQTSLSYARRMIDSYTGSNVYYISGLVRADNLTGNLDIQAMAGFTVTVSYGAFDGTSNYPGALFGFSGDGSQVDLVVRHRDDSSVMTNSVLLSNAQQGEVYFVVLKIEFDANGTSERLTAWLNPTEYSEVDAAPVFTTTGAILTTNDQINYMGFWIDNFISSYQDYVQFDELRMATTWNEAVPVPPQTLTFAQNFSVPGDSFMKIDEKNVAESPQTPSFDVTPTGWKWGGHADDTSGYRVEVDQISRGGVTFDELALKNSVKGYAYTIFDSSGSNEADSFIDMTGSWATMDFKISDIYSGSFEHPSAPTYENGSGLPSPGNLFYAPVLRALIRDANGDWYGSGLFCPSTYQGTDGDLDGTVVEYSLSFDGLDWYKYSQTEIDNLNALAGSDDIALTHEFTVDPNSPDLTQVSGMGVYVWNGPTWSIGSISFTEISLTGAPMPAPVVYWDTDELADMADEWLVTDITWEETMDSDPASGSWILRDSIQGDYVISGGEMTVLGNSYGAWRLDSDPPVEFDGEVNVTTSMKATSSSDTTEGSRSGINLWINTNVEAATCIAVNQAIVLDGANQYVEFISDWAAGVAWPPSDYLRVTGDGVTNFNNSMLDIDLTIAPTEPNALIPDPDTYDVNYTISDQAGTTAAGTFKTHKRYESGTEGIATIYTGGAQGVIDYVYINGNYVPQTDRTDDNFVDYEDFVWLAERWLTERVDLWP
ncbi:MAG: hypothetical protein ACIAQZ_09650 [Sedimentisphaeraceae bacterium JB056]